MDPYSRSLVEMVRDVVHLELPQPPSANAYWRLMRRGKTGGGRIVRTADADAYREAVWLLTSRYRTRDAGGQLHALFQTEPLALTVKWYRRHRRGDLDNSLKVLLDSLQHSVYTNDSQIVELHAYRIDGDESVVGGRVLVDVVPRVS